MTTAHGYWEWREEQLKHPDGRAKGGEPCVVCGQPVPAEAHWQHRDRHICSSRCNYTLNRRFNRKRERGEIQQPAPVDPYQDREPMLFGMDESLPLPFDYLGWSPRVGDVVSRYGSNTTYVRLTFSKDEEQEIREAVADSERRLSLRELKTRPRDYRDPRLELLEHGVACVHLETGSVVLTKMTDTGSLERVVYRMVLPDGTEGQYGVPFEWGGRQWTWKREFIRHVEPDGTDYTWEAEVCVPYPVPDLMRETLWTPEYRARSETRARINSSTARHARRVRMVGPDGEIERIDPHTIYERDGWMCQLCHKPIDPAMKWPDYQSASLDHIVPLAANGTHTSDNVQAAHLICNIQKGARG